MTKSLNLKIIWLFSAILTSLLLVSYIIQISSLSQKAYQINDYKARLNQLSKNNNLLDINFSKMNSLSHVDNYLQNKDFIKSSQVKYIQVLESSVASNK